MEDQKPVFFRYGDLSKIAVKCGISRQYLNNIMRGKRSATPVLAAKLVMAASEWCYQTQPFDWLFPLQSDNPLFAKYKIAGKAPSRNER